MKNHGCAIALLIIAGVLGVGIYWGIQQLNSFVSRVADNQLRQVLSETDFGDQISYGRIEVSTTGGWVSIHDLSYVSGNRSTQADAEVIQLSLSYINLLRLARAGERMHMDGIGISVNGGSLTDTRRGTSFDVHDLKLQVSGDVSLQGVDELYLTSIDLTAENLNTMHMVMTDAQITLSDEMRSELAEVVGDMARVVQHPGWRVEQSVFSMQIEQDRITIEEFSIDSSLLAIDGTLEIHLNDQFEPDTIQGEFFIGDLVEELRGDGLPSEGPFTIAFGVDPQGEPYYEIH